MVNGDFKGPLALRSRYHLGTQRTARYLKHDLFLLTFQMIHTSSVDETLRRFCGLLGVQSN